MINIAVLLTCFNRRATTLRCLRRLFEFNQHIDVFLVDDLSTDGTPDAVMLEFPRVHVISGSGDLFWNRGMHLAWASAAFGDFSHYLWLNDDVVLYAGCFSELLSCSAMHKNNAIISGIIEAHNSSEILYGGTDNAKHLLVPNGMTQTITNMNGNVVLVPATVFSQLGNLDPYFYHDLGDVDYGLRAKKQGIPVLTTRIAVGSCDRNNACRVRLWGVNILKRFEKLYSPLGNHPRINFYFRQKHFGLANATSYYVFIHLLNLMPDRLVWILFGDKYIPN